MASYSDLLVEGIIIFRLRLAALPSALNQNIYIFTFDKYALKKEMVQPKDYMKYIFVITFVFVIYLAYIVVRPFVTALVTSAILAYIFYPIYELVSKKIKRKNIAALAVSIFIIILLAVPFFLMVGAVAKESQIIYIKTRQMFVTGDIFSMGCAPETPGFGCSLSNWIRDIIGKLSVRYHLERSIESVTGAVSRKASEFVLSLPTILLNIFVTFFTTFYLFKDGKLIIEKVKKLIPVKMHHQKQIMHQLDETAYAIIYGSLLVAAVQGAVGAIGYFIFGISSPIMWGMLTAIFALLPFVGTALVWVPLSLFAIVQGATAGTPAVTLNGVGLLLYGALIIASIDNILKPYVIGRRARIHPILVLIGVLGGLALFGFIGFILGPLILAIFANFLEIYETEKAEGDGLKLT